MEWSLLLEFPASALKVNIWYPESWKLKQREGKTKLILLASIEPYMGSTSSWKLPSVWFFYCEAQPNSFAPDYYIFNQENMVTYQRRLGASPPMKTNTVRASRMVVVPFIDRVLEPHQGLVSWSGRGKRKPCS